MKEQERLEKLIAYLMLHLNARRAITFGELGEIHNCLMKYRNIIVEQNKDNKDE